MENKEYLEVERVRLQEEIETSSDEVVKLELLKKIDRNNRLRLAASRGSNEN